MLCYAISLALVTAVGMQQGLSKIFFLGMLVAAGIAVYHWTLIRGRDRMRCFAAFRHNNWLGAAVFAGVVLG
jgi:4-hydroxybenzoate polyprenyltransferase